MSPHGLSVIDDIILRKQDKQARAEFFNVWPGATFFSTEKSLEVEIRENKVEVKWNLSEGGIKYPRYKKLRDLLSIVLSEGKIKAGAVCNISYENELNEPSEIDRVIKQEYLPRHAKAVQIKDVNWSWGLGEYDYRVEARPTRSNSMSLITTCGRFLGELPILDGVDEVHRSMNAEFLSLIADSAKLEWGFKNEH